MDGTFRLDAAGQPAGGCQRIVWAYLSEQRVSEVISKIIQAEPVEALFGAAAVVLLFILEK